MNEQRSRQSREIEIEVGVQPTGRRRRGDALDSTSAGR